MSTDDHSDILTGIERFIARHQLPPTTFGRKAIGDPNLIPNLRDGRELRRATEKRVRAFMETYSSSPTAVAA